MIGIGLGITAGRRMVSYDPAKSTGMLAAYEADRSVAVSNGQKAATISDLTPNANHLTQSTSGNQPTYRTTGGPNGKAWLDGSSGSFWANLTNAISTGNRVYVVGRISGQVIGAYGGWAGNNNGSARAMLLDPTGSGVGLQTAAGTGLAATTTVTTGANSATQTVGATAGWRAGEAVYFATANVVRIIQSVTNSTTVVFTQTVNTTTGEAATRTGLLRDGLALQPDGFNYHVDPLGRWGVHCIALASPNLSFVGKQDGNILSPDLAAVYIVDSTFVDEAKLLAYIKAKWLPATGAGAQLTTGLPAGVVREWTALGGVYTDKMQATPATDTQTVLNWDEATGSGKDAIGLTGNVTYRAAGLWGGPALRFPTGCQLSAGQDSAFDAVFQSHFSVAVAFVPSAASDVSGYHAPFSKAGNGSGFLQQLLQGGNLQFYADGGTNAHFKHWGGCIGVATFHNNGNGTFNISQYVAGGLLYTVTNVAIPADQLFSLRFGGSTGAFNELLGDVCQVDFWSRELNSTDAIAACSRLSTLHEKKSCRFLWLGNSYIDVNSGGGGDMAQLVYSLLADTRLHLNLAVSGQSWTNMLPLIGAQAAPFIAPSIPTTILVYEDTNDIVGAGGTGCYNDSVTYITALRAAVGTGPTICMATMLPQNGTTQGNYNTLNAARRADFPTNVSGHVYRPGGVGSRTSYGADFLLDLDANTTIGGWGAQNNTTNYNVDAIHPNATGRGIEASEWQAAIVAMGV